MAGSIEGGRKARDKNRERYGEDYYKKIGKQGGQTPGAPKGFAYAAANGLDWHKTAGAKGGSASRRGAGPIKEAASLPPPTNILRRLFNHGR